MFSKLTGAIAAATLGLASLGLTALPVTADMVQNLGPMAGIPPLGEDDGWTAQDSGGWFMLSNPDKPGAIKYYWIELPEGEARDYTVTLNLVAQSAGADPAYAGLLFNFKAGDSYFAVTIGTDGQGHVFVRRPDGFAQPKVTSNVVVRNDGADVIRLRVADGKARFEINGETFLSMESPDGFSPKLGIVAIGQGTFGFTGFSVDGPA